MVKLVGWLKLDEERGKKTILAGRCRPYYSLFALADRSWDGLSALSEFDDNSISSSGFNCFLVFFVAPRSDEAKGPALRQREVKLRLKRWATGARLRQWTGETRTVDLLRLAQ
jgi:hypothetical protein